MHYTYIAKTTSVMLIVSHLNLHQPIYIHIKLLFASFPLLSTPTTTNNAKLKLFKNISLYSYSLFFNFFIFAKFPSSLNKTLDTFSWSFNPFPWCLNMPISFCLQMCSIIISTFPNCHLDECLKMLPPPPPPPIPLPTLP